MNMIQKALYKLFSDDAYGVALRKKNQQTYQIRYPDAKYWYADPFICEDQGKEYVFVEALEYYNGLGRIAVGEVIDGKIPEFKVVIQENFHLSYPNVFQYENQWYMIPETSGSNQMRLYQAKAFPYEWVFVCTLMEDVKLVDTIFHFVNNDEAIGLAYDLIIKEAKPILLDMKEKKMCFTKLEGSYSLERPGGSLFEKDGHLYRAIQDCVRCYGDYLHFYEIEEWSKERIVEKEVYQMHAQEIVFSDQSTHEYMHTYNCDEQYEVIDFRYRKQYPLKAFARFMWKFHIK